MFEGIPVAYQVLAVGAIIMSAAAIVFVLVTLSGVQNVIERRIALQDSPFEILNGVMVSDNLVVNPLEDVVCPPDPIRWGVEMLPIRPSVIRVWKWVRIIEEGAPRTVVGIAPVDVPLEFTRSFNVMESAPTDGLEEGEYRVLVGAWSPQSDFVFYRVPFRVAC